MKIRKGWLAEFNKYLFIDKEKKKLIKPKNTCKNNNNMLGFCCGDIDNIARVS